MEDLYVKMENNVLNGNDYHSSKLKKLIIAGDAAPSKQWISQLYLHVCAFRLAIGTFIT